MNTNLQLSIKIIVSKYDLEPNATTQYIITDKNIIKDIITLCVKHKLWEHSYEETVIDKDKIRLCTIFCSLHTFTQLLKDNCILKDINEKLNLKYYEYKNKPMLNITLAMI